MTKKEFVEQFVLNCAQYISEHDNMVYWAEHDNSTPTVDVVRQAEDAWEFINGAIE